MNAAEYEQARHECRAELARRLGWQEVPNVVWAHVDGLGLVYAAVILGDEESWRELERETRDYRRQTAEEHVPPGREERGAPQEIEVELDEYTRRRSEAFSEVAVALAELRPDVRYFRQVYLGGRLLTEEEADAFLEGRDVGRWMLDRQHSSARKMLDRRVATLARFYGWSERDAARFLLTGHEPEYRPVRVAVGFGESTREYVPNTARAVVTADVWTDKEEVARAFGTAQRQLLGGDNRKKPDKVLEAVRFVARQIREHGSRPSWRKLLESWNRTHPDRRYKSHNALVKAFERFVHPKYNRPKYKRREPTPYQRWRKE